MTTGAHDDCSALCSRSLEEPCKARVGVDRPNVPERLHPSAAVRQRRRGVLSLPSGAYLKDGGDRVGRALRTENTINNTRDYGIGKSLKNLEKLKEVGFAVNRRLLEVEKVSHDCTLGEKDFRELQSPVIDNSQRAAALRFGDPRVLALFQALVLFSFLPEGFRNRDLRERYARLLGIDPTTLTQGRMTYQLRRLLMHGLIERIPKSHRYQLTDFGLRVSLFLSRLYARAIRPGLSFLHPKDLPSDLALQRAFNTAEKEIHRFCEEQKLAA